MLTTQYKGQTINIVQKGQKISAKVGGVVVATSLETAQEAVSAAQKFIDSLVGPLPVVSEVNSKSAREVAGGKQ